MEGVPRSNLYENSNWCGAAGLWDDSSPLNVLRLTRIALGTVTNSLVYGGVVPIPEKLGTLERLCFPKASSQAGVVVLSIMKNRVYLESHLGQHPADKLSHPEPAQKNRDGRQQHPPELNRDLASQPAPPCPSPVATVGTMRRAVDNTAQAGTRLAFHVISSPLHEEPVEVLLAKDGHLSTFSFFISCEPGS